MGEDCPFVGESQARDPPVDGSWTGPGVSAAISADGRLLAYVKSGPHQSLHVKQIVAGSEVTVLAQPEWFQGLAFAPNGDYVYYTHTDPDNDKLSNLYSVPWLGGSPTLISPDVDGAVAFSPDGKQIVYRRNSWNTLENQLIIAMSDGSDEHIIFDEKANSAGLKLLTSPSWSASLNLICAGFHQKAGAIGIFTPSGELTKTIPMPFEMRAVSWLSDGSGILVIGAEKSTAYIPQIWLQPYPSGEPQRISNDLGYYEFLNSSTDGKVLITNQRRMSSTVYVGDSPAVLSRSAKWNLQPVSTEQTAGYQSLSWTTAGNLAQIDMWNHFALTSATGTNRVRLLGNDPTVYQVTSCGPGDQLAITRVSDTDEVNIWIFDPASGGLRQITSGKSNANPSCTPDGKWVIYQSVWQSEPDQILKVPNSGGSPVKLASGDVYLSFHAVSPDGQRVVYFLAEGEGKHRKVTFIVQKLEAGPPGLRIETLGDVSDPGWTPDGNGLSFLRYEDDGTSSLWIQRLSGGVPERLMHFDSEPARIIAYACAAG